MGGQVLVAVTRVESPWRQVGVGGGVGGGGQTSTGLTSDFFIKTTSTTL